jgi:hypothetical protein
MSALLKIPSLEDSDKEISVEIMQGDGSGGLSYTILTIDDGKKEHKIVLDLKQTEILGLFLIDGVRTEQELVDK